MKRLFTALVASCLLLASCSEKDFEEVKNLSGVSIDDVPFAVPVGDDTLNGFSLLSQWQNNIGDSVFSVNEDGLISFSYKGSLHHEEEVKYDNVVVNKPPKSDEDKIDTMWSITMPAEDVNISLFDNFPDVEGMNIEGISADIDVILRVETKDGNTPNLFAEGTEGFMGEPMIKNLKIFIVGENGEPKEIQLEKYDTIFKAEKLLQGDTIHIVNTEDTSLMRSILNSHPRKLRYSFGIEVPLHGTREQVDQFLANYSIPSSLEDVVNIRKFIVDANVRAEFPLRMSMKDVGYSASLKFDLIDVKEAINKASSKLAMDGNFYFAFKFVNELPISLTATDYLKYENSIVTYTGTKDTAHLFAQQGFTIEAAPTVKKNNYYRSNDSTIQHTYMLLNKQQLERISGSDSLVISFKLNTPNNQTVEILESNKLHTYMYILVNPSEQFLEERFGKATKQD